MTTSPMTTRKALAAAVLLLALAGCGGAHGSGPEVGDSGDKSFVFSQQVNGKTVWCVWVNGYRSGGLSCDWAGAR